MTAVEARMLTGVSDDDRTRLTKLLIRCAANLTDLS
jgi:hypothetical protein